jgi:hypothetical protein
MKIYVNNNKRIYFPLFILMLFWQNIYPAIPIYPRVRFAFDRINVAPWIVHFSEVTSMYQSEFNNFVM